MTPRAETFFRSGKNRIAGRPPEVYNKASCLEGGLPMSAWQEGNAALLLQGWFYREEDKEMRIEIEELCLP